MLDTRKMSLLELYEAQNKPIWTLTPDEWKAARVLERRRNEWLKANSNKTQDDWYDTWYPGGWNQRLVDIARILNA